MRSIIFLACVVSTSAFSQQLPPLEPVNELIACRGQVEWNLNNARIAAGYAEQYRVENLGLASKVATLEAKLKEATEATPASPK